VRKLETTINFSFIYPLVANPYSDYGMVYQILNKERKMTKAIESEVLDGYSL